MRHIVPLVIVTGLTACGPPAADYGAVFDGTGGRWVDLTQAFSESTIYWPTDTAGFRLEELAFGPAEAAGSMRRISSRRRSTVARIWTRRFTLRRVA